LPSRRIADARPKNFTRSSGEMLQVQWQSSQSSFGLCLHTEEFELHSAALQELGGAQVWHAREFFRIRAAG